MSQKGSHINPEEVINDYLISHGTTGCKQSDLVGRIQPAMSAQELSIYLHQLHDDRKVDKYIIRDRGRPAIWWRATTKMLED